jgi:hypothetical protein
MLRGQVLPLAANSRLTLRKSLIVFQFLIAQVFIIGALTIGQQLRTRCTTTWALTVRRW